jgi:hypothetical protein
MKSSLAHLPSRRTRHRETTTPHGTARRLCALLADVVEIAVWTSPPGHPHEHGSFLLGTTDGRWHTVGFGDSDADELVTRIRALPNFDTALIGTIAGWRHGRIVSLWRASSLIPRPRTGPPPW